MASLKLELSAAIYAETYKSKATDRERKDKRVETTIEAEARLVSLFICEEST